MDFRHLRAFVAVAEERNFTRAAQRLHISQPPLTRQIRQLEDELGVALFVRHRTGAEMTCEGAALLDTARAVTTALGDFESSARSVKTRQTKALHLGIGWGLWKAVNLVREDFAARCPDVPIVAHDLCELHRGGGRADQHIDVAVTRPPLEPDLASEPLFEERFVALLAEDHPLASRSSVTLSDLASEPLLLFERKVGPSVYDKILALWVAAGIKPLVVERQPPPYGQEAMMLVASRQGYYLGIASQYTQTHRTSGVAVIPVDEPDARLDIYVAWHRNDTSNHVREFVRSARQVFPLKRHATRLRRRSA
ncbi:MAG TPA: LysR substrate-binding domain-containing protein [Vicinamibacterales bacterium]|nr:LysR substrate-binding domain-containing protein [Vicinamibacterales bacterium]